MSDATSYQPTDIQILGATYTVNCLEDELEQLRQAEKYINQFMIDLKKNSPTLDTNKLLVLCCLNLYQAMQQNQIDEKKQHQAQQLINQLIHETKVAVNQN